MRVDVRHPVHAAWITAGSRKPVEGFVPSLTPCEVPHVPDASMREVVRLEGRRPLLCEHAGLLWQRLEVPRRGGIASPASPDEMREFLASGDPGEGQRVNLALTRHLAMTPFAVLRHEFGGTYFGHREGGCRLPEGARVLSLGDGANAAAFVATEILVTDSAAYMRYRPVAGVRLHRASLTFRLRHLDEPVPWDAMATGLPYRPDLAHGILADVVKDSEDMLDGRVLERERGFLSCFSDEDEDLRVLANWLPHAAGWFLRNRAARPDGGHGRPVSALAERLRPLAAAGLAGGIPACEAGAALRTLAAVVRDMQAWTVPSPGMRPQEASLSWIGSYAARAGDRLDAGIAPEDEDALGGMAP